LAAALGWSVHRRKPFKPDGQGLPDAAVWLTALREAQAGRRVVLLTANSTDFCADGETMTLAVELESDLEAFGIAREQVSVVKHVRDLLDQILPAPASADARAIRLLEAGSPSQERLIEALRAQLLYRPLSQDDLDLPVEFESDPQAIAVDLDAPELVSARELTETRLLLDLRVTSDVLVSVDVPKEQVDELDGDERFRIVEPDRTEYFAGAEADLEALFDVQLSVENDGSLLQIESLKLRELDDTERVERRLDSDARTALAAAISATVAINKPQVGSYMPPDGLDSAVDNATLRRLAVVDLALTEVEEVSDEGPTVLLLAFGAGEVEWLATSPTPGDVQRYAGGDAELGENWIGGSDENQPVEVEVRAFLDWSGHLVDLQLVRALGSDDPEGLLDTQSLASVTEAG